MELLFQQNIMPMAPSQIFLMTQVLLRFDEQGIGRYLPILKITKIGQGRVLSRYGFLSNEKGKMKNYPNLFSIFLFYGVFSTTWLKQMKNEKIPVIFYNIEIVSKLKLHVV